jgi:DNA-directed RNA polymerase III subunit RPC1
MIKSLEDVTAQYDGTVRNSQNQLICLVYLDGMAPTNLEKYLAQDLLRPSADPVIEALRAPLAAVRRIQTVPADVVLLLPFNMERYLLRFYAGGAPRLSCAPDCRRWTDMPAVDAALAAALATLSEPGACLSVAAMETALQPIFAIYPEACLDQQRYHAAVVLRACIGILTGPVFVELAVELAKRLERCALQAGLALGPRAATSISKPSTQECLNSFHSTGAELKTGTARMKELIEQSPSADCFVIAEPKQPALAKSRRLMQQVADSLLPVRLGTILRRTETREKMPAARFALQRHGDAKRHLLLHLDVAAVRRARLTMPEILRHIKAQVRVPCTATSLRAEDPYVALHFDKTYSEQSVAVAVRGADQLLVRGFAGVYNVQIKPRFSSEYDPDAPATPVFDLHCVCKDLSPFFLSDAFDLRTLRVSNVAVSYQNYGIESALFSLFSEIKSVVTDSGASHVNNHHIYLLSCNVCQTGRLLAATRFGMQKGSMSVMQRASFEWPKVVFVEAATFGEQTANISKCLSTSTITGGICGVGTGMVQVYPDAETFVPADEDEAGEGARPAPLPKARANANQTATAARVEMAKERRRAAGLWMQWWDHAKDPETQIRELYESAAQTLEQRRTAGPSHRKRRRQQQDPEATMVHNTLDFLHSRGEGRARSRSANGPVTPVFSFAQHPLLDKDLRYMGNEFVIS